MEKSSEVKIRNRPLTVLSIDGGGIRGIIPARVLAHLERKLDYPLHRYFDLVIGTSTGGLIAAGLTTPQPGYGQLVAATASRMERLYIEEGPRIFPKDRIPIIRNLSSAMARARYAPEPLEAAIKSIVGEKATIKSCRTGLTLTAYDIEKRRAVFMSNVKADDPDFRVCDAALASCSAPTYFPPARTPAMDPNGMVNELALVDGGVFANDPVVAGYVEAAKIPARKGLGGVPELPVVFSFGTGQANRPYPFERARKWGIFQWISPWLGTPIISILMQGQASTAAYQINSILNDGLAKLDDKTHCTVATPPATQKHPPPTPTIGDFKKLRYYRLDGPLGSPGARADDELDDLDNASPRNMARLQRIADRIIAGNAVQIEAIVARLTCLGPVNP